MQNGVVQRDFSDPELSVEKEKIEGERDEKEHQSFCEARSELLLRLFRNRVRA